MRMMWQRFPKQRLSTGSRITLGMVSAGWLISLALLLRLPFFDGLVGTALAVMGLFVLPGIGWLALTDVLGKWPLAAIASLAFVSGLIPYSILSGVALIFSYPAQAPPAVILLGGQATQTILLALLWWRMGRGLSQHTFKPLPETGLIGVILGGLLVVGLALVITVAVSDYLPLGPQDSWDYANTMQWTADHPSVPPPRAPGLRFSLNTWINLKAALVWGTGTTAVDLLMRFLPAILLVLSSSATYGLAFEASGRRRVAWLAVIVQTLMVLTYVGDNARLGIFATLRLGEDKSLIAFIILPVALIWLMRWLEDRRRFSLIWLVTAAGLAVVTHPSALGLFAISGGAYFILTFVQNPDWQSLRRLLPAVIVLVVPLLILGAIIGGTESVGLGVDLGDVNLSRSFAFAANQLLLIGAAADNQYIVHPRLLHPFMYGAMITAVIASAYARRKEARFLIATILVPTALLFVPFLTPLLAQAVTLTVLERFLWLWPVGLAWGLALDAALRWLVARRPQQPGWGTFLKQIAPGVLAIGLVALSAPYIEEQWAYQFWYGETLDIQPAEIEVRDVLVALAAEHDTGIIHVAPPDRLLPMLVGYTPQVVTHTFHRLEGLKIVELTEMEWINVDHLGQINKLENTNHPLDYVIIERDAPSAWHLYLRPDQFTPVFEGSGYVIFHFENRPDNALDGLLVSFTDAVRDGVDFEDPVWDEFAALLALQVDAPDGSAVPDAPPVIAEALGWLAFQRGDYQDAVAHFDEAWQAAPESIPLFATLYVDALIALDDLDVAGRLALELLPLAAPHDVDLVARLGDLGRRQGPETPHLATLYDLALAPDTAVQLRRTTLQELLATDLIKDLDEGELDTLLGAWDEFPPEARPSQRTIATNLIGLRRDLDRGESWLETVPEGERNSGYWLTRAHVALVLGDHDDARAAVRQAREISTDERPNVWESFRSYVPLLEGHLAAASGDDDAALIAYQEAFAEYPGGWVVNLYLASAYEQLARWDEAIALYEEMAVRPGGESYWGNYGLARVYDQLGQTDRAEAAYEQGIAQQRLHSPDLPIPPRDALPIIRNPAALAPGGQLTHGGISIVGAETLTRILDPGAEAVFRVCAMPILPSTPSAFWQFQVVEPDDSQLLGRTRQAFPVASSLQVMCWPVTIHIAEFERPEPPLRAQLEVVSLIPVRVEAPITVGWTMLAAPTSADTPVGDPLASFGDPYTLLGADWAIGTVDDSGAALTVTLTWRAETPPLADDVFLVHLLDAEGTLMAQHDQQPYAGRYPTSVWPGGAVVAVTHTLDLPADLPPGTYTLLAGMYNARTMDRLPGALIDGTPLENDLLLLGELSPGNQFPG